MNFNDKRASGGLNGSFSNKQGENRQQQRNSYSSSQQRNSYSNTQQRNSYSNKTQAAGTPGSVHRNSASTKSNSALPVQSSANLSGAAPISPSNTAKWAADPKRKQQPTKNKAPLTAAELAAANKSDLLVRDQSSVSMTVNQLIDLTAAVDLDQL
jgi:hypothetical protein